MVWRMCGGGEKCLCNAWLGDGELEGRRGAGNPCVVERLK
jgi:hypothetical protein